MMSGNETIVFRVDASDVIGTGHVVRCLTLAEGLADKGARCLFVCRSHRGNLMELIRRRGFEVFALPAAGRAGGDDDLRYSHWLGASRQEDARQTAEAIADRRVPWLVVDHYAIDRRWQACLRRRCDRLLVIDDLADRRHDCDMLLDQNWFGEPTERRYDSLVPAHCNRLLGPAYALLRPEYLQLRNARAPRDGAVRRILIFAGGSDRSNETLKMVRAMHDPRLKGIKIDVVIGVNHPDPAGVRDSASTIDAQVHQGLPSLAELMDRADLMIGAGGATTWERMCLGLPSIVITVADNQTPINAALMRAGYITYLGSRAAVTSEEIAEATVNCMRRPDLLREQSQRMQRLVPGDGTARVAALLIDADSASSPAGEQLAAAGPGPCSPLPDGCTGFPSAVKRQPEEPA